MDFKAALRSTLFSEIVQAGPGGIPIAEVAKTGRRRGAELNQLLSLQFVECDHVIKGILPRAPDQRWSLRPLMAESSAREAVPESARIRCSGLGAMARQVHVKQARVAETITADQLRTMLGDMLDAEWTLHGALVQRWNGASPQYRIIRELAANWAEFVVLVQTRLSEFADEHVSAMTPPTRKTLLVLHKALSKLAEMNLRTPSDGQLKALSWIQRVLASWSLRVVMRKEVTRPEQIKPVAKQKRWTKARANDWLYQLFSERGEMSSTKIKIVTKQVAGPAWGTIQKTLMWTSYRDRRKKGIDPLDMRKKRVSLDKAETRQVGKDDEALDIDDLELERLAAESKAEEAEQDALYRKKAKGGR